MIYFADVRWGSSERPFVLVIPAEGRARLRLPRASRRRGRASSPSSPTTCACGRKTRTGAPVVAGILKDRGVVDRRRSASKSACASSSPTACAQAAPAIEFVLRDAGHRRLPHDQVAGRDCADAARQRHHDRGLPGRVRDAARGHDAGRARRATSRAAFDALGGAGGGARSRVRQVHGLPARQHHAAAS